MFYKMVIAYNGSEFLGYQDNKSGPTIEGKLTSALEKILQHPVNLEGASRTDRGVHAEGQVITFETHKVLDLSKFKLSLNQLTPASIAVLSIKESESFHPTLDAKSKTYGYTIHNAPVPSPFHNHTAWHIPIALNLGRMQKAAKALIGKHNFQAFTQDTYDDYNRTIEEITLSQEGEFIHCTITGDSFMYKMVRNIVGTLVLCGKDPSIDISTILKSKKRSLAGMCAPAHGLVLKQITY